MEHLTLKSFVCFFVGLHYSITICRWTPFIRHFRERHSGKAIELGLDEMLDDLGLLTYDLVKYCVADNASNMKKAIRESR